MVLKRIGVLSAAKIGGVMYAALGLIMGVVMAGIFSMIPMPPTGNPDMPSWLAPMFGAGALVLAPIMYGVMGFIGGAVSAVIYNLFANMVGGVELHLESASGPS